MKTAHRWIVCLIAAGASWLSAGPVLAQFAPNEREVRSESSDKDKTEVWTLDLKFKDPRMIRVHVPGQGTRIYWYLWYQIVNRTGEPRKFVPYFEIVTLDYPAAFPDGIYPTVEDAIRKLEDPTGYQKIKNSVTISAEPIPISKPDAFPRAVTGVAIWEGTSTLNPKKAKPNVKELSDTTRFSIFVRGLSNGYVIVNPLVEGKASYTRYKTLQLNFRRIGDRYSVDARDMVFLSPAEWLYRPGGRTIFEEKK